MKTLLFTLEYPPFKGGVGNVYENIVKHWPSCAKASAGKAGSPPRPIGHSPQRGETLEDGIVHSAQPFNSPPSGRGAPEGRGGYPVQESPLPSGRGAPEGRGGYLQNNIFVLHNNDHKLIKPWLRPRWLLAIFKLDRAIAKNRIKHVLVGHILPLGWVMYIVNKWHPLIKYSVFLHGMDFEFAHKSGKKARQSAKILKKAEHIFCGNSYLAGRVKKRYPELAGQVTIVNPGIDPDDHYDKERVRALKDKYHLNDKIVFLSLGRLVKRKGVDISLEAFKQIVTRAPKAYYVIAGQGPDKEYLKEKAKGIPNVIFITEVDDQLKWDLMHACDVFIMPSRDIDGDYEGFGIVYLEAALCGKPVIAGDSGGIKDAVKGAHTGILVDGTNVERVAGAMLILLQDKDLRIKMGEAGRVRAVEEFGWESKISTIYQTISK